MSNTRSESRELFGEGGPRLEIEVNIWAMTQPSREARRGSSASGPTLGADLGVTL